MRYLRRRFLGEPYIRVSAIRLVNKCNLQGNMHTIPALEVQQIQQWMSVLGHIPNTSSMHNMHPNPGGIMPSSLASISADQGGRGHEMPDFRTGGTFQGMTSFQGSLPSFQGTGTASDSQSYIPAPHTSPSADQSLRLG